MAPPRVLVQTELGRILKQVEGRLDEIEGYVKDVYYILDGASTIGPKDVDWTRAFYMMPVPFVPPVREDRDDRSESL